MDESLFCGYLQTNRVTEIKTRDLGAYPPVIHSERFYMLLYVRKIMYKWNLEEEFIKRRIYKITEAINK